MARNTQSASPERSNPESAFIVTHTTIDGIWNEGDFVTASAFKGIDTDRLLSVGAVRKATPEDYSRQSLIAEREALAREQSESSGRTPTEVEADVDAQSRTGNPVGTFSESGDTVTVGSDNSTENG